jgi:hypothetical protein
VSFDIYPAVHDKAQIAGHLDYVAKGVDRLVHWTYGKPQLVWNCIECTHISNPDRKPTRHEVRAEAWMSLIHGSQGLIYFVHEFKPKFREAGLLSDAEMLAAVTQLNHEISSLAPVLNEPSVADAMRVRLIANASAVDTLTKRHNNASYVFAVEMEGRQASADFRLSSAKPAQTVEVIGEDRSITLRDGSFTDSFKPWDVHLYRLGDQGSQQGR